MARTSLYRHFDGSGVLLYVGISLSAVNRLGQHEEHSHWFSAIARVDIEHFDTREQALDAETLAIARENPLHNKNKRPKPAPVLSLNIEASRSDLTARIVRFQPLYTELEAANVLGMGPTNLRRLIDSKKIGHLMLSTRPDRERRMVSGWQLIDYIEALEAMASPSSP